MSRPTQVRAGSRSVFAYGAFTLFGRPSQCRSANQPVSYSHAARPTTPSTPKRRRFGLLPFRSPLLRESLLISTPPGTEMVQFPGSHSPWLSIHHGVAGIPTGRVTPFGYLWIIRCLLLPTAFRSLPRPFSSDSSKASTVDPYSLDHITLFPSLCVLCQRTTSSTTALAPASWPQRPSVLNVERVSYHNSAGVGRGWIGKWPPLFKHISADRAPPRAETVAAGFHPFSSVSSHGLHIRGR